MTYGFTRYEEKALHRHTPNTCRGCAMRKMNEEKPDRTLAYMAIILTFVALFFWMYLLTPTVKAEESMDYREIHTKAQVCQYLKAHPYTVIKNNPCV